MYIFSVRVLSNFLIKTLCKLKKQWFFINIAQKILRYSLSYYHGVALSGFKLAIAGKINGRRRKKTLVTSFGSLKAQSINRKVKFCLSTG